MAFRFYNMIIGLLVLLYASPAFAVWGDRWGEMVWGVASPPEAVPLVNWVGAAALVISVSVVAFRVLRSSAGALLITGVVLSVFSGSAEAEDLTLPYLFSDGQIANADEVNTNFHTLAQATNSSVPYVFSNGEVASAAEVNANFEAVRSAAEAALVAAQQDDQAIVSSTCTTAGGSYESGQCLPAPLITSNDDMICAAAGGSWSDASCSPAPSAESNDKGVCESGGGLWSSSASSCSTQTSCAPNFIRFGSQCMNSTNAGSILGIDQSSVIEVESCQDFESGERLSDCAKVHVDEGAYYDEGDFVSEETSDYVTYFVTPRPCQVEPYNGDESKFGICLGDATSFMRWRTSVDLSVASSPYVFTVVEQHYVDRPVLDVSTGFLEWAEGGLFSSEVVYPEAKNDSGEYVVTVTDRIVGVDGSTLYEDTIMLGQIATSTAAAPLADRCAAVGTSHTLASRVPLMIRSMCETATAFKKAGVDLGNNGSVGFKGLLELSLGWQFGADIEVNPEMCPSHERFAESLYNRMAQATIAQCMIEPGLYLFDQKIAALGSREDDSYTVIFSKANGGYSCNSFDGKAVQISWTEQDSETGETYSCNGTITLSCMEVSGQCHCAGDGSADYITCVQN